MKKSIIIEYKEYICSDNKITSSDEEVIFEIVDTNGRMVYVIGNPGDLLGDVINNVWKIESIEDLSESIFTDDIVYDDEYFKSTYLPTKEEEEAVHKLFNEINEENGGN